MRVLREELCLLCGFATFADNPIVGPELAEAKLATLARARDVLLSRAAR